MLVRVGRTYLVVEQRLVSVFEHAVDEGAADKRVEARRAFFHRRRVVTALYLHITPTHVTLHGSINRLNCI